MRGGAVGAEVDADMLGSGSAWDHALDSSAGPRGSPLDPAFGLSAP